MKDNPFQSIVVGIFAALTVAGFMFFAVFKSPPDESEIIGNVTIWGIYDQGVMSRTLEALDEVLPVGYKGVIRYVQKSPETYNDELVEALASDSGPDIFMLSQADIVRQINKVHIIPYTSFPERTFKDRYIEGAEIYLTDSGIVAFPFAIDPLIMFYNRNILVRANIPLPPTTWVEFFELSPKITERDEAANIRLATVPFGEFANVTNGKAIISALLLQAGDKIVEYNREKGDYEAILGRGNDGVSGPAVSILRYYTEFSNPTKPAYSWNRSLPDSRRMFNSGSLAFYFGFASELEALRLANPNNSFDISPLPQIDKEVSPKTFANMQGMAVSKGSRNKSGAFRVASFLTARPVLETFSTFGGLPPIDMLVNVPVDDIGPVLYKSALISHAWLEPDSEKANTVFRDMIESISSGRLNILNATREAREELTILLK